jgi:hypothetical protein
MSYIFKRNNFVLDFISFDVLKGIYSKDHTKMLPSEVYKEFNTLVNLSIKNCEDFLSILKHEHINEIARDIVKRDIHWENLKFSKIFTKKNIEIIAQNTSPLSVPGKRGFGWLNFFLVLLVLALAGTLGKVYMDFQDVKSAKENIEKKSQLLTADPNSLSDEELINYLAQKAQLPDGTSSVATVKDVESLRARDAFFTKAQNGDKVLLFDREALLYRPGIDKIINFGPTNDSSVASSTPNNQTATTTETGATATEQSLNIEIRNGTQTSGLAGQWKTKLEANKLYKVVKVGNAGKDTYTQTYLVNLTNKDVSGLERELGVGAVSTLPEGEVASNQDVLIIVSK